jgi:hypothetical protein
MKLAENIDRLRARLAELDANQRPRVALVQFDVKCCGEHPAVPVETPGATPVCNVCGREVLS